MKKSVKLAMVGLALLVPFSTTACVGPDTSAASENIQNYAVTLPDNTKVDCVLLDLAYGAGMECLWDEKSKATQTNDNIYGYTKDGVTCVWYDGNREAALDCKD